MVQPLFTKLILYYMLWHISLYGPNTLDACCACMHVCFILKWYYIHAICMQYGTCNEFILYMCVLIWFKCKSQTRHHPPLLVSPQRAPLHSRCLSHPKILHTCRAKPVVLRCPSNNMTCPRSTHPFSSWAKHSYFSVALLSPFHRESHSLLPTKGCVWEQQWGFLLAPSPSRWHPLHYPLAYALTSTKADFKTYTPTAQGVVTSTYIHIVAHSKGYRGHFNLCTA